MSIVRRIVGWVTVIALLELATRAVVYALAPEQSLQMTSLSAKFGGPQLVVVALVAIGLAVILSTAVLAIAARGARSHHALRSPDAPGPKLPVAQTVRRAGALTVTAWLTFAAVESYTHWRAGLGFHGLNCLWGPVHVNAMPVAAGLAIVAAAALTAAQHLLRWMRRVVARLLLRRPVAPARPTVARLRRGLTVTRPALSCAAAYPRPPPSVVA